MSRQARNVEGLTSCLPAIPSLYLHPNFNFCKSFKMCASKFIFGTSQLIGIAQQKFLCKAGDLTDCDQDTLVRVMETQSASPGQSGH